MSDVPELKHKDHKVLEQLIEFQRHQDEPVQAGTLSDVFEWADRGGNGNPKMIYRLDKLADHGLVETWQADERTAGNKLGPRVAKPTEKGMEQHETDIEGISGEETLAEKVEKMDERLIVIRDTYSEVKNRIADCEDRLDEFEERMGGVEGDVDGVARDLEDLRRYVEQESGRLATEEFEFSVDD